MWIGGWPLKPAMVGHYRNTSTGEASGKKGEGQASQGYLASLSQNNKQTNKQIESEYHNLNKMIVPGKQGLEHRLLKKCLKCSNGQSPQMPAV